LQKYSLRLVKRATDNEESISARIFKAEFEMGFADKFDCVLVNNDLEETLKSAEGLVQDFINS
jgi:guanylate kinase